MKLYDLQDLADLLGRSPDTIKRDMRCNPLAVPPRVEIPGTRILRWREEDIRAWLSSGVRGGGAA